MEQPTGLEPVPSVWKTEVLPLHHGCIWTTSRLDYHDTDCFFTYETPLRCGGSHPRCSFQRAFSFWLRLHRCSQIVRERPDHWRSVKGSHLRCVTAGRSLAGWPITTLATLHKRTQIQPLIAGVEPLTLGNRTPPLWVGPVPDRVGAD